MHIPCDYPNDCKIITHCVLCVQYVSVSVSLCMSVCVDKVCLDVSSIS